MEFMQGRIDKLWWRNAQSYYDKLGITNKREYNRIQWTKTLILVLWKELYKLWESRNKKQHAKEDQATVQRQVALKEIEDLYTRDQEVCEGDRTLFETPLEELRKKLTKVEWPH